MWLSRIKIILVGVALSLLLSFTALLLDDLVRPKREILMLNLRYLVYAFVLSIAALAGGLVSLVVLLSRSLGISLIISLFIAITISIGLMRGAIETFSKSEYFDAPMFYADMVQIGLNLVIYPTVCFLVFKLLNRDLTSD